MRAWLTAAIEEAVYRALTRWSADQKREAEEAFHRAWADISRATSSRAVVTHRGGDA